MANVYIESHLQGGPNERPITDYVVKDREDTVLSTHCTPEEAINWAKVRGHHPLVSRVRHRGNKGDPDHWRSAE